MTGVAVGQIWRATHASWPERYIRIQAIRGGTAHAARCLADGSRYPRPTTYRIDAVHLERGGNPSQGLTYALHSPVEISDGY